ncbi:efflux transporter outer membrane subunit [Acidovorax sp. GBBC 1281]|uniref:efflux transporter outer membrane subunit n=1 Tax=Acidovorax sp. GBBC 1281 TaxID=2940492 RepID=UPI00234BFCAF|nr:efflux transporter outer membrane subunit [Acidovorax sp. GBBC 1281]WCN00467.1 efflux transporter outer membrane subunit [Acidovorax sp. GBBC 1281]
MPSEPQSSVDSQSWWTLYNDPDLERLQQLLLANSPDIASALARYQQAQAASDVLRAAQLPTVNATAGAQRNRQSERRPLRVLGPTSPDEYSSATLGLELSYELDLWGRVRQRVEAGVAEATAAQADLAAARLALQAQLADTLIALRGQDADAVLLRETVASYERAAQLIGHRQAGGVASGLDLSRAQAQLESTRSQLRQTLARRALLEHSIAALVGESASRFSIEPADIQNTLPSIPPGMPSTLLQRRADIAAAQQRVIAANANVGVARTAFFPLLTLSAQGGMQTSDLGRFVEAPNLFWVIGPALVSTVFDGGRRKADVARAQAQLDESGQRYRSVVLAAFQQVEDQLALLARFGEAAHDERSATQAAARAVELATNRFREGAASYLEVTSAQTVYLQARRSALDLDTRQRRATVQLVRALGGGWSAAEAT